jgi:biopolymer transport protein ExbB
MLDFIMKGGILMYPILLCSVIALAIIMERLYHFQRAKINVEDFKKKVMESLANANISEAMRIADDNPGPVAKITRLVLADNYKDSRRQEETISRVGSQEIRKLEQNLRGLSIISNITPLLGLLGTVTGMIRAFMKIQELGGGVDSMVLAGGIWEAMITTGAGLAVAIPVMVAYHLFEGKVDNTAATMKDVASEIGEMLGVENVDSFIEETRMAAIKEEEGYGI